MQSNSVFAMDQAKASINERASMLSTNRLKYIDDMHKKILEKIDNYRYGMISSLNSKDIRTYSELHRSLKASLELYYIRALSSIETNPCEIALIKMVHFPSEPGFNTFVDKQNAAFINGNLNIIQERVELNTLEAKEKVIRDSLAEAAAVTGSKQYCQIL